MTQLYEIFNRDPRSGRLANGGQTRIVREAGEDEMRILRSELQDFVCEGVFADTLQIILERYTASLGKGAAKQDAAWVSGFFGSGKSHLLKMLVHLWVNTEFEDGVRARDLTDSRLTGDIKAALRELDTLVDRSQKAPVAAAGTLLGGNEHVRLTVLSILLGACGWPEQYAQAKFCFWLRDQGILDQVRGVVESAGKDWFGELNNLYVSSVIAGAVLKADPALASDDKEMRRIIRDQFPTPTTDIVTKEFIEACRKALSADGELPLTLIVLDEVQQYINESTDRAKTIVEVTEAFQSQFDSKVLVVGAGQSALTAGTAALQWLSDRFTIKQQLTDADVESVTRQVLLQKLPSAEGEVRKALEGHSGEISRHLQSSKLADRPEDRQTEVIDYPLLSTRRRFWEATFRAVDKEGSQGQLRSQLRIVNDSLSAIAERDLGEVIPASDLFNALSPNLVANQVLLNEISSRIAKLADGTPEGTLRRDLCGLVFLIGKLPREDGVDTGVRATADSLADLMIPNIASNSGKFRDTVARELEDLAEAGTLMKVDSEYRLQTTEGAKWDQKFREKQQSARNNEPDIKAHRDALFGSRVQELVGRLKLTQGDARVGRTVNLEFGNDDPAPSAESVVVWLRDGWSIQESEVSNTARRLGQESAVVQVFLPKRSADPLKGRIIDAIAAQQVIDTFGTPSGPEGLEALAGMKSRLANATQARDEIVADIIRAAKVLKGGGTEVFGDDLKSKLGTATEESLVRLFPRFRDADHKAWAVVGKRAKDGSDTPLQVLQWDKPTEEHPVAKEVMAAVGAGAKGAEIRKKLKSAPYGWPQDAVDSILIALTHSGHLKATKDHQPLTAAALDGTAIGVASFRSESVILSTIQKIGIRGLFNGADVQTKSGEEEVRANDFLTRMGELANAAGGKAPLPAPPDLTRITELSYLSGNEQLLAMLEHKDELTACCENWKQLAERAKVRLEEWGKTQSLVQQAAGLDGTAEVVKELDAVCEHRSLLEPTDHLSPLLSKLAASLRARLTECQAALTGGVNDAIRSLEADATWKQLDSATQGRLLSQNGLKVPAPLSVSADKELSATLQTRPLAGWQSEIDAIGKRRDDALEEAGAELAEADPEIVTTSVAVERGTLQNPADVDGWLKRQGERLHEAVAKGPVIVK